jgi:hypothetical protein
MNSFDSHEHDSSDAAVPIAQPPEIADGRRELARLIGRLLAHDWLHKQRTGRRGHDHDNAADDEVPRPK